MDDTSEAIEEARSRNGRVALLIAALAACLALVEVSGDNADQQATKSNIDASNLWAFFQAKTIRRSTVLNFTEFTELLVDDLAPERQAVYRAQIEKWKANAARLDSEPETQEGRKELMARAQEAEKERDLASAAGDLFGYASASFQLGIVLASASIVISVIWLAYIAGGLGIIGLGAALLGWFIPTIMM